MTKQKTTNNIRGAGRKPSGRICMSVSVTLTPRSAALLRSNKSMGGFIAALIDKEAERLTKIE